ncbi:aminoglycoside adenylyltransferase domain-containing protein [Nocardia arthritidis]|uniref:aminoglycoside adenylyltransferase domain-containing protein n=1 Tax=Nocardia arthritidis TaxID=228602 RepID=UPI003D1621B4
MFAPVATELVLAQLVRELRWAAEHAAGEYAVLNACRAWRFAVDSTLVSKIDGGRWAMDRVPQPDRELIRTALNRQRCLPAAELSPSAVEQFVHQTLARVTSGSTCGPIA